MFMRARFGFLLLFFVVVGCTDRIEQPEADPGESSSSQPFRYETVGEQKERQKNRDQHVKNQSQRKDNGTEYKNISNLSSDEENEIIDKIMKRKRIKEAQVASSSHYVIISLLVREGYTDQTIRLNVEDDVRAMFSDRQIVIFTDDYHWNQMIHLKSRLASSESDEERNRLIEDYLRQDQDSH